MVFWINVGSGGIKKWVNLRVMGKFKEVELKNLLIGWGMIICG